MPPRLVYTTAGRFGNNLFQYMAAHVFGLLHGHVVVDPKTALDDPVFVGENSATWGTPEARDAWSGRDVKMDGYYQNLRLLGSVEHRAFLKRLFSPSNEDMILGANMRASELIRSLPPDLVPGDGDLVMHIRQDDFIDTRILETFYFVRAMGDRSRWGSVWIVTDVIRNDAEKAYVWQLANAVGGSVRIQSSDRVTDWNVIRCAKNVVSSNSTFAWTALLLGDARWAVLPDDHVHGHQIIVPIEGIAHCEVISA